MFLLCKWWIQKISEGMTVCERGGDHGQKTVFEVYSRQYNPFVFVSAEEKWKKNSRGGGRRRTAGFLTVLCVLHHSRNGVTGEDGIKKDKKSSTIGRKTIFLNIQ